MTRRQNIRIFFLRALVAADGVPMPDAALISAVCEMAFPRLNVHDVRSVGQELETEGLIKGISDPNYGVQWAITNAGKLAL